jgi:hypothetical protein
MYEMFCQSVLKITKMITQRRRKIFRWVWPNVIKNSGCPPLANRAPLWWHSVQNQHWGWFIVYDMDESTVQTKLYVKVGNFLGMTCRRLLLVGTTFFISCWDHFSSDSLVAWKKPNEFYHNFNCQENFFFLYAYSAAIDSWPSCRTWALCLKLLIREGCSQSCNVTVF